MLKLWDKTTNLILPNGEERTPEQIYADPNYGFTRYVPTPIEMRGPVTVAIENLYTLMDIYEVDESLDEQAALDAVNAKIAAQREEQKLMASLPTTEERIASALEFQNLMSL